MIVSLCYFQIFETLISNAKTTSTKQLSGPEKLPGLSRNGPQAFEVAEVRTSGLVNLVGMVVTGQEIVRETKNSSRSGKSRGISL